MIGTGARGGVSRRAVARSGVLAAGRLVSDGVELLDAWVRFDDGVVAEIGTGDPPAPPMLPADPDGILVPGFVDLHCHGGFGAAFDDGADAIATARAGHLAHGTTRAVLSLVTAPMDELCARAAVASAACAVDPLLLGIHLEGPFLSGAHRGAHAAALLRAPAPDDVARLIDAAAGRLVQVTLAPELDGAEAAIDAFVAAGVGVALGHTAASAGVAARAFDRGAQLVTHAFNGMRGLDHRDPGPLVAAFDRDDVTMEVIADGLHVHPRMVRLLCDQAPGHVAFVTDAMAATGMPDGAYRLGALDVEVREGVPRLAVAPDGSGGAPPGLGALAGSTLTMDEAVRVGVTRVGLPLPDAIAAATSVPADAIGVGDRFGRLAPGFAADAVLLDASLDVRAVVADGVLRHG